MTTDPYNRPHTSLLIVVSGASGVGKDTLLAQLRKRNAYLYFTVNATTRAPRPGEVHGKDYFFMSKDEFAGMIENDELLEYAVVYEDFKGVPKQQVRDAMAVGKDVVLRIDVQGAASIRKLAPEAVMIFIMTESEDELVRRLEARATESSENLRLRIATARKEMEQIVAFDYYVVNAADEIDAAVAQLEAIIAAEHSRVAPRRVTL